MTVEANLFTRPREGRPLADRLRPVCLNDVVGQDHLLDSDAPLGRMVSLGRLSSIVFWGPPGCGKTTIARLLAKETGLFFEPVSAVASGVSDLRRIFESALMRAEQDIGTLLFVDEIHRFNRAQQDVLLPYVEDGTVVLVGATTENPSFALNGALLSRAKVLVLKRLEERYLAELLKRAEMLEEQPLPLNEEAREALLAMADGDGRYLLGMVEDIFSLDLDEEIDPSRLASLVQKRQPLYDKAQDSHYNLISALHKSIRGSDPDAAMYWFSRMLNAGEDPRYIGRRLLRIASEDVGMADPQALPVTLAACQTYERLGSPEGELALAQALVHLATAPKSNALELAYNQARVVADETGSLMPPKHILNAPTKLMRDQGYHEGYQYDHDTPEGFSGQEFFPEKMQRLKLYNPVQRGFERDIRKRLDYWEQLRAQKKKG